MDINALYAAMKGSPLVGPLYSLCPHPNFGKFFFVVLLIFLLTLVSERSIPLCHVCTLY